MPQRTLRPSGDEVLIPVPEGAVSKLHLLLSRPVELTDGGFVLVRTDELDALFTGYIPAVTGSVQIPDSIKRQGSETEAAITEAVLTVQQLLQQPHLLLLGGVDWNRRLCAAISPGSPTYVGPERAAQAASLILELSYSDDSDDLVAAARAVLAED